MSASNCELHIENSKNIKKDYITQQRVDILANMT